MIEVERVGRTFRDVAALTDVDLRVPRGTVLGLLGHNGAGKTTLVNILTTVLPPSTGTARVAGYDVTRQSHLVRQQIGLTGQFATVDEQLTGAENLILIARLLGATRREARARADELLELFDLGPAAQRKASTYSGGMRRRLDLATSLVGHPSVVFLDEPTTGLDPASRIGLWEIVEGLVDDGTTILLTTQYLEEADRLADSITVLSAGKVVAAGTAGELKAQVGQRTVTVAMTSAEETALALAALRGAGLQPVPDDKHLAVTAPVATSRHLAAAVRALDDAGVDFGELSLHEPTLDDVYLALTHRDAA
ncbi:ATP-binding cassette domain-containing protein [Longimycelium tulufanense]|nr:ATP-binding cassette domain-containing protein [Longimycelium tulufanense]